MYYHQITTDDMNNGEGLRVVLWVAGCNHYCFNCHNKITWDASDGLPFDFETMKELKKYLSHDYISGLTLSGGDPLYPSNREAIYKIIITIKEEMPDKTIWLYTGYTWEEINDDISMKRCLPFIDVLVDGPFIDDLKDINYHWAGSTNQRVIDVKKSLEEGSMILYENH